MVLDLRLDAIWLNLRHRVQGWLDHHHPRADLCLPDGCVMVSIIRPDGEVLSKGHTVLYGGDRIAALLRAEDVMTFHQILHSQESPQSYRHRLIEMPINEIEQAKELSA